MKDELNSVPLDEVAALRPKCYCLRYHGKVYNNVLEHTKLVEKPTATATKKSVKDEKLMFDHYYTTLTTKVNQFVT